MRWRSTRSPRPGPRAPRGRAERPLGRVWRSPSRDQDGGKTGRLYQAFHVMLRMSEMRDCLCRTRAVTRIRALSFADVMPTQMGTRHYRTFSTTENRVTFVTSGATGSANGAAMHAAAEPGRLRQSANFQARRLALLRRNTPTIRRLRSSHVMHSRDGESLGAWRHCFRSLKPYTPCRAQTSATIGRTKPCCTKPV